MVIHDHYNRELKESALQYVDKADRPADPKQLDVQKNSLLKGPLVMEGGTMKRLELLFSNPDEEEAGVIKDAIRLKG